MNSVPSCCLISVLDGWEASISFLGPSPLCRPYIKSITWHHHFDFLATFLDPKKWCRRCIDTSTKGEKRLILCPRPKKSEFYEGISTLWQMLWPSNFNDKWTEAWILNPYKDLFIYYYFLPSSKWPKNDSHRVPPFLSVVDFYKHKWSIYIFRTIRPFYISDRHYCFWSANQDGALRFARFNFLREELFLLMVRTFF